jgi:hypothetical protein
MATDGYVPVSFHVSYKTKSIVEKLAVDYGLSRGNTLMKLVEMGIAAHGDRLETSTTNSDGEKNTNGVAKTIKLGLRDLL